MSKEKEKGSILTPEELAALAAEVEQEVDKDFKTKERERLKLQMLDDARIKRGLAEPVEPVEINLPEHADRIVLNSFPFMHGRVYEVRVSTARQLRETMFRAWEHQAVVEGRRKDFYTKRNTRMSGISGATVNAPILRA